MNKRSTKDNKSYPLTYVLDIALIAHVLKFSCSLNDMSCFIYLGKLYDLFTAFL